MLIALDVLTVNLDAFGGRLEADNFARLFIVIVGVTLALVGVKVGVSAGLRGQWNRAFGSASYACFAVTPAVSGVLRFGEPLSVPTAVTYSLGLIFGTAAVSKHVQIIPPWRRRRTLGDDAREGQEVRDDRATGRADEAAGRPDRTDERRTERTEREERDGA